LSASSKDDTDFRLHARDITEDEVLGGRLRLRQPKRGYRFSLDAVLLADFAPAKPGQTVVDLGAGAGVIALALARRMGRGRVIAVEVQNRLAELARENAAANRSGADVTVMKMNWASATAALLGGPADLVVCNPPYRKVGAGRINPDDQAAAARHELLGTAAEAITAARRLVGKGGWFCLIYPATRLAGLIGDLRQAHFEPKRLKLVHSRRDAEAKLALIAARLGGGEELTIEPPLIVYDEGGNYTAEAAAILSGERFDGPTKRPVPSSNPGP
jgi:tRNA1Val (adenine37-N6)-methyltransferase